MNKEKENLGVIVERIATKYAKLVENRIDAIQGDLTGIDLSDTYDGIQRLGHIVATMERFGRMESAD